MHLRHLAASRGWPAATGLPAQRGYSREAVLAIALALLIAMLGVTAFVSRQYHRRVHRLADEWFARAEAQTRAGHASLALADYRNALSFAPASRLIQFHLAQALAATHRDEEAASYLNNLLAESPGGGEINLELARLAARENHAADALRYYHGAIYGEWQSDPMQARWKARRELCDYLLRQNADVQAQPEIIALADNALPREPRQMDVAGQYLLRVQLWDRALNEFRGALGVSRRDPEALAGAGTAAFQLGNYSQAVSYLDRVPKSRRSAPPLADMLATSRAVVSLDPFAPGLSIADQAARAAQDFQTADARLQSCALQKGAPLNRQSPPSPLQQIAEQMRGMRWAASSVRLRRDTSRISRAISRAFQAENLAAQQCGQPPAGADAALILIGRNHGGSSGAGL